MADVVSLADARRARALPRRDRFAAQVEVQGRLVVLLARARDAAYTPNAARTVALGIMSLADQAEGRGPSATSLATAITDACPSADALEELARQLYVKAGEIRDGVRRG